MQRKKPSLLQWLNSFQRKNEIHVLQTRQNITNISVRNLSEEINMLEEVSHTEQITECMLQNRTEEETIWMSVKQ